MEFAELSVEEFVGWIGGKFQPKTKRVDATFFKRKRGNIFLVWGETDLTNQPVISVHEAGMQDFYAFASTYVATHTPLSSFFWVVPFERLNSFFQQRSESILRHDVFQRFIGLALIEAYCQSTNAEGNLERVSMSSVSGTLSVTLMSAIQSGYDARQLGLIGKRWSEAHRLSGNPALSLPAQDITEVWKVLSACVGVDSSNESKAQPEFIQAYRRAFRDGLALEKWFLPLVSELPGLSNKVRDMFGAREIRVKVLVEIMDALRAQPRNLPLNEFVAGGVLSMLGSGSLRQLGAMDSVREAFPKAPLWFAAISALNPGNDALEVHRNLGRHALKFVQIKSEKYQTPDCDISYEELVLSGKRLLQSNSLHTAHSGKVKVYLLDAICAVFRNNFASKARVQPESERKLDRRVVDELQYLIDRAGRLTRSLHEPEQPDFFDHGSNTYRKK